MNRDQLLQISPLMGVARADTYLGPLNEAMARYLITSNECQAHFISQVLHESDNFKSMVENLNYKPASLQATFNTRAALRFTDEDAEKYGRTDDHPANQRMIAILAYGGRMGNRPDTEDGWRYRGRGPIQMTGLANYKRCGESIGFDLVAEPELLEQPEPGCLAAAWFWHCGNPLNHSLNALAEAGDVGAVTRAINGGDKGLVERFNLTQRALKVLS